MKRLLTILAAMLGAMALALPVAAHQGAEARTCEDPDADPTMFVCGHITVTLTADAEVSIEEVIARVAGDAAIEVETEPTPPSTTYALHVPEGEEWAWVLAFRDDEAVEVAHVIQVGQTTEPTATPDATATPAPTMLPDAAMPSGPGSTLPVTVAMALALFLIGSVAVLLTAKDRTV